MFQYTPSTNSWTWKAYYPGPQTGNVGVGMSIGNRAFVYKDGAWIEYNLFTVTSFPSKICTNETIPISFDASGFAFPPGITFTAQISTQLNFSASTNLGSLATNASSGIINANFQSSVDAGDYYFRIITNTTPQLPNALSTLIEPITVTALPVSQSISIPGGVSVCKDAVVVFTSNLTGTGFQWYKNNNPAGDDSPTYTDNSLVEIG